jgi:aminoglycoside phosphotransferase (APT) family kinase protein
MYWKPMGGESPVDDARADVERGLADLVRRVWSAGHGIDDLRRLSGGANQETWAFDVVGDGPPQPLVLRRTPGGSTHPGFGTAVTLAEEARTIGLAGRVGVPVPGVRYVLVAADALGEGYLMDRIEGETIARKILRDDAFAAVRPRLARQCGEILGRLRSLPAADLTALPLGSASAQLGQYRRIYDEQDDPHAVFEVAFRWLEERCPDDGECRLVHGDFRNGNLLIGADGIRAVLDWELVHRGDPMEDLGWLCVNSWRFGEIDLPVGGFGMRVDLFAGYEAVAGVPVDAERVRYWEVMGSLKWGIMCMMMYRYFAAGLDRSVERAAIGRRASEAELDLLTLLYPEDVDAE